MKGKNMKLKETITLIQIPNSLFIFNLSFFSVAGSRWMRGKGGGEKAGEREKRNRKFFAFISLHCPLYNDL